MVFLNRPEKNERKIKNFCISLIIRLLIFVSPAKSEHQAIHNDKRLSGDSPVAVR